MFLFPLLLKLNLNRLTNIMAESIVVKKKHRGIPEAVFLVKMANYFLSVAPREYFYLLIFALLKQFLKSMLKIFCYSEINTLFKQLLTN